MILNRIVETKRIEVSQRKEKVPLGNLTDQMAEIDVASFSEAIRRPETNIIAEIKYRSPSHGPFRCQDTPEELAGAYAENGAAAISVLTDETFFGGSIEYLKRVSEYLKGLESERSNEQREGRKQVPLLCKDFIIDRYQIAEAVLGGASAYLLIVACLGKRALSDLQEAGREYSLEPLVEVHDSHELEVAVDSGATIIGVNNRDLRSFEVNVKTSFEIARRLEGERMCALVSESGISEPSLIAELRDAGFNAFLIGTALMDSVDPSQRLRELLSTELS